MSGFPPLDLQTEHLDRNQYPSLGVLLLVAVVMCAGLMLSWASQRTAAPPQMAVAQHNVRGHSVDREMFARVIPLRP